MIGPAGGARIRGRLEPAARRQDVITAVLVHVAGADAVAVAAIADRVLDPGPVLDFIPGLAGAVLLGKDFARLPVVVQVGENGELHVEAGVDRRLDPGPASLPGVPEPGNLLREPGDAGDVGITVAI